MSVPQDIFGNVGNIPTSSPQSATSTAQPSIASVASMIRNISQTVQEREIVKTAPDLVVFIDGLPYLTNIYVNDPKNGKQKTYVNFNDHVVSFSATYDTESMVPNCTISLQVPNFQKYLYQMPGGNNLLQTMAQVQVYAKGYYMSKGDTVYRRVFKGVTSYIGYNDNGKILSIDIQCHGIMHLLEKMQDNIHPSAQTSSNTGVQQTFWQSKYGNGNCFQILAQVFTDALRSDMFQIGSINNTTMYQDGSGSDPFWGAVRRGYMAKWQAILTNMIADVHIFGPHKDTLGRVQHMVKDPNWGKPGKDTLSASVTKRSPLAEKELVSQYSTYYDNIAVYKPFATLTAMDLKNSVIVNRLDLIRDVVQKMDYEAYQDVDGKIIIKPPLYNLDVVNVGTRTSQTQTNPQSSFNSLTNQATQVTEGNNPFIVYLSEILTEQESEDQSAIRKTRTTVAGNIDRSININADTYLSFAIGEYIDVAKMAKFGLREEPLTYVPWIDMGDSRTLFVHAVSETVRANRGYRTYTFSIPMRPELKVGFPVFLPHKDMYAYIKTISLNYSVGGTATMTVTCDSIRRRVMINTHQTSGSGNSAVPFDAYTPAPNLIYQWTKTQTNPTTTQPNQSPQSAKQTANQQNLRSAGTTAGVSNNNRNISNLVGTSSSIANAQTNPDKTSTQPSQDQRKIQSIRGQKYANKMGNMPDSPFSTYVIKNDNSQEQGTVTTNPVSKRKGGYFDQASWPNGRPADLAYLEAIIGNHKTHENSVIPFTDDKGYEVIAPFPWGRYVDLNTALATFTQAGWLQQKTKNDPTNFNDAQILANADAFLFAGLGTPTANGDPSTELQTALALQSRRIGGSITGSYSPQAGAPSTAKGVPLQSTAATATPGGLQQSNTQPDATVIVLHYNPALPSSYASNVLVNHPQPEDVFAQQLLPINDQTSLQQTVDVLVSGSIAPSPTVKEELFAAQASEQNEQQVPQNVKKLNIGINQPSNLNLVAQQTANFNSIKGGQ